jgi:hypothetical protein
MDGLAERLVGTWLLEAYVSDEPDGTVREPFGPDATGVLVYLPDGRMAVQVMDPRRPRWARGADGDERRAQVAAAAEGYIAYAGRFEVEDGPPAVVVHHVEISLVRRTGSAGRSGGSQRSTATAWSSAPSRSTSGAGPRSRACAGAARAEGEAVGRGRMVCAWSTPRSRSTSPRPAWATRSRPTRPTTRR